MSEIHYIVKSGDNLGFISEWFHVGLSDLKYWNNIDGTMIRAGQKLLIYVPDSKVAHYKKINEMSFAEKQKMIGKDVGTGASQSITNDEALPEDEDEEPGEDFIFYTIRSGDTLWEIAQKYPGVTDTDIMKLNNITDADKIQPGQVIKIKRKS